MNVQSLANYDYVVLAVSLVYEPNNKTFNMTTKKKEFTLKNSNCRF